MSLVEVVLQVPAGAEPAAIACLLDFSPHGFRHEPAGDDGHEHAEFGVYTTAENVPTLEGFVRRAGVDVQSLRVEPVADDWSERWKEFHQPVTVGGMWVGPPWQADQAPRELKRVVIEPGQGFGTGAHPTTRLMLSLLPDQPRAGVLDIGCGSGVLSIAASMLGFRPVVACDNDPAALESTRDNLRRNDVTNVDVRLVDATVDQLPRADIVLANLTLPPLRQIAPRLRAPRVIASGLLRSQAQAGASAFEEHGYVLRERRDRDGWVALVLDNMRDDQSTMYQRPVF